jgi:hypothetical protein
MHEAFSTGFHRLALAVLITSTMLGCLSRADAASIDISWTAPTTNADGSSLRDLAGYRLYVDTSSPACPGGDFLDVSSSTATPASGQRVSDRLTGLNANTTYFARVTAVDRDGKESACSPVASGVAQWDVGVTPTSSVSFGSVATGATVDRTFTVENTSDASVAGSASVGAPFRIASGGSFSLAPGAKQNVVVRFQPTTAGSFAGNVSFTADGDTLSRGVNGVASGGTTSPPSSSPPPPSTGSLQVFITQPDAGATVEGTEWVVLWVEGTSGSTNTFTLSANGTVVGSQTTSARGPVTIAWTPVANGTNTLTASVRDAAGHTGSSSVRVNVVGASGGVVTPAPAPEPEPTANDSLTVAITQPTGGAIVDGTAWVVIWVEGATGSNNTFTLSVDGSVVGSETTGARGPVVIPWTVSTWNGNHTLTATVRDAAGNTGRTSIPVTVRN